MPLLGVTHPRVAPFMFSVSTFKVPNTIPVLPTYSAQGSGANVKKEGGNYQSCSCVSDSVLRLIILERGLFHNRRTTEGGKVQPGPNDW